MRLFFNKGVFNIEELNKAVKLMDAGNLDDAISLIETILLTATDEEKILIIDQYYEWGFFDKSIAILEELLTAYPNESVLQIRLAEMYIEIENDERAIKLLNSIDSNDPAYLHALINLADLYQAQGLFEVSEQKLIEAKKIAPTEIVIDFALGELLFSIGEYNRAIPFFEKVTKEHAEFNYISMEERLAESYALNGNYEQALVHYAKISSKDPNTLFKYGFTAHQVGKNEEAIQVWSELIEVDPHYHTAYYELANVMKQEGLLIEALEVVKKGLLYDEYNKELYLLASQLHLSLNNEAEGIDHVKKAISLDSDYKEAVMLLIQLYRDKDDHEAIIALIEQIKAEGGTDPLYDWELAKSFEAEEDYPKALSSYQEASVHLAHDSEFLKEYGYFLTEEGNFKVAIEVLTNYLQIEPQDEDVILFLDRLRFSEMDEL